MGLENDKKQFEKKLDQLEALLFLTFNYADVNRRDITLLRESLDSFTKPQLKQHTEEADAFLKKLSDKYGLKTPLGEMVQFYRKVKEGINSGKAVYYGRWLFKLDFSKPHEIFGEAWNELPNHVLLAFIPNQTERKRCEYYLPEIGTYVDVCVYVNRLIDLYGKEQLSMLERRDKQCFERGAILRSYNFLEAYFNGIALDHYLDNPNQISKDAQELIYEWSFTKNTKKHLSTRDKMLKYVKLRTGAPCPLLENNCHEVKFIFEECEQFRDSIVHPNILWHDGKDFVPTKMSPQLNISKEFVLKAVDSVISLIRKIHEVIGENKKQLHWLYDRGPDGRFPKEAFD